MKSKAIIFPEIKKAVLDEVEIGDPGPSEITVKNAGCGICQQEIKIFKGILPNTKYPQTLLGHEGIGHVIKIGKNVNQFKEGDLVTTLWRNAFIEYNTFESQWAEKLPEIKASEYPYWISEPAACVVNGLRAAGVPPGSKVLLIGAGYMGLLLIQGLSRTLAGKLAVTDIDESKLKMAKNFGANEIINSAKEDLLEISRDSGGYDIVIEATGIKEMIQKAASCCAKRSKVVVFGDHRPNACFTDWMPFAGNGLTVVFSTPAYSPSFEKEWHDAIIFLKSGIFNQKNLITHIFKAQDCQKGMETVINRPPDYIKGYFSWL